MKIKTFAEYSQELAVNEIGDASTKRYSYDKIQDDIKAYYRIFSNGKLTADELIEKLPLYSKVVYRFKTDKGIYTNEFLFDIDMRAKRSVQQQFGENALVFSFSFSDENETIDTVLNRGEMFSVMSTVTSIIKHFLEDYPQAIVCYYAIDNDPRRYNMYKQYVEKQVGRDYEYVEMKILGQSTLFIQNKKYK